MEISSPTELSGIIKGHQYAFISDGGDCLIEEYTGGVWRARKTLKDGVGIGAVASVSSPNFRVTPVSGTIEFSWDRVEF